MQVFFQSLRQRCHINTNRDGNCFVGIKVVDNIPQVHFPIGYNLPTDDNAVRQEILVLLKTLEKYADKKILFAGSTTGESRIAPPVSVCLEIIQDFSERGGYYIESEYAYKKDVHGKINWSKTIKKLLPLPSSTGSPIYTQYMIRKSPPAEKNLITQIHKFCVFECFSFLGWIFTAYTPEKPSIKFNKVLFLSTLISKLNTINNDRDKKLMGLLKMFVEQHDFESNASLNIYGTEHFEYVWEKIIDSVFGIRNKQDYFPKTQWCLRIGVNKFNAPLEPDSIMAYQGKIYILDAKYYKFGVTGNIVDLPQTASINKQITYGEYVAQKFFLNTPAAEKPIFNAFLMPFNAKNNTFGRSFVVENIGEAIGLWKNNDSQKYERVQGILIDTRYLVRCGINFDEKSISYLATAIESVFLTSVPEVKEIS